MQDEVTSMENILPTGLNDLEQFQEQLLAKIKEDMDNSDDNYNSVDLPSIEERYNIYFADKDYYKSRMPKISKQSQIVSTDTADTIEWALPSLMKLFFSSNNIITIEPVNQEDAKKAEIMKELISYQLERKNNAFLVFYNWFKDAMITGLGIVKCYWQKQTREEQKVEIVNFVLLQQMQAAGMQIVDVQPVDAYNYRVEYINTVNVVNQPKIENIIASEFRYLPGYKSLAECPFVAHKKRVTMSYLRQMEREGIFANVDLVVPSGGNGMMNDALEVMLQNKDHKTENNLESARKEVDLWECYVKVDSNGDGILEDLIIHVAEDIFLRVEENYYGRHPFFAISPMIDPHRIWPKRSYADLIGQLQEIKTALQRQIMINIALTNDPKMILSEEAINISDYVEGRSVIRKKPGFSIADVAQPLPVTPLHPWTFQYLEFVEGQKENRTGITRYNQGLDASSLNKTATGISQIMGASNQRLELIARIFSETGIQELFRFLIGLNQKFIDENMVIRLTNETLEISPDDIQGNFDLVVNAGVGISSKESTMLNLQTLMTALQQIAASGVMICTPTNIFNLMKRWMEEAGLKNFNEYITDPMILQQKMMMENSIIMSVVAQLPPELQQLYMETGTLPPQVIASMPPEVQMMFQGRMTPVQNMGGGMQQQQQPQQQNQPMGSQSRTDNRNPQITPRAGNGPPKEK